MGRNFSFKRVSRSASLSRKNGLVFVDQIWYYKALKKNSMVQRISFMLSKQRLQNKLIGNSNIRRKLSGSFKVCLASPEK